VTDDGRGIDPDDLPHLFDKFYRAGQTDPKRADAGSAGAGLGLSICKGLVEAMGGEITVTSPTEIGRGARFTVSFATPGQPKSATAIEAEA
jgi:two-component system sensor histidine kinase KdpD